MWLSVKSKKNNKYNDCKHRKENLRIANTKEETFIARQRSVTCPVCHIKLLQSRRGVRADLSTE